MIGEAERGSPARRAATRRRLHVLVAAVCVAGAASVASSLLHLGELSRLPALWEVALTGAAFAGAEVVRLRIRFGHDEHSFTWAEGAVVLGLVLLPSPWLLVVGTTSVAIAHLGARRPPVKVAFNSAGVAAGIFIAHLVLDSLGGDSLLSPGTWAALALASLAYWAWNGLTVSAAVAYSQGLSVLSVYRKTLVLNFIVWLGNTAAGITGVVVAVWEPRTLLMLPVFVALLSLLYRGYLRAMEERDVWQVLHAASRELHRLDHDTIARVVLERSAGLFKAEFVELMITDGEPGTEATLYRHGVTGDREVLSGDPMALAAGFWPRAFSEREPFQVTASRAPTTQRNELEALGLAMCIVAPLVTPRGCLGTLRIGFEGVVKMRTRELQVFATFANQVSTSVHNARLFEVMNEDRATLSRVVDNSSDGILSVDADGRVMSWSPAMARITGHGTVDVIGQPLFAGIDCRDEEEVPVTTAWVMERVSTFDQTKVLVSVLLEDGSRRWLDLSIATVRSPAGECESAVIVARDVTSLREVEEAKQDFVATVSHELRTPLTSLKGFLLTLLRPQVKNIDTQDYYRRMLNQARRLERLIEDLLSVSQLEKGELVVEPTPVNVDEAVERVVAEMAMNRPSRAVEQHRAGMSGTALADGARVEQVLSNLLINADKYSAPGLPILITVERHGTEVRVSVSDEGPGIPEDQRDVVFQRFHRLGHHLTREQGGTGLGLYIARRLIEAMGGRIWIEDRPGPGTTFVFTVPAAPFLATAAPEAS